MWSVLCLISASLLIAEAHNATDPRCAEGSEELDDINRYDRSGAKLYRLSVNYTTLGIRWTVGTQDAIDICSFTVHVWKASKLDRALHAKNSHNASSRDWLIEGLDPGTQYEIVVETIYATKHQPLSWTLQTSTMGYGPDRDCQCNSAGTTKGMRNKCDWSTGQCDCKINTYGRYCEKCDDGFYMHDPYGCVVCDQCPPAKYGGNGTCVYARESQMKCVCLEGYRGNHCEECAEDYYRTTAREPEHNGEPPLNYAICTQCDCTKNNKSEILSCFEQTGNCKACTFLTTGPICDYCIRDYRDKSLNETCQAMIGIRPSNTAVVALFVTIMVICLVVVLFVLYRRRMRNQRIVRFFEEQWKDYHDDIKFSNMMEDSEEMNFGKARTQ